MSIDVGFTDIFEVCVEFDQVSRDFFTNLILEGVGFIIIVRVVKQMGIQNLVG